MVLNVSMNLKFAWKFGQVIFLEYNCAMNNNSLSQFVKNKAVLTIFLHLQNYDSVTTCFMKI